MTKWNSEFGQFTIESATNTYAEYTLTSTNPFVTNWPWSSITNPICSFTNIGASIVDTVFQLPSVLNAISIATNFQLKNVGTEPIAITTYTGATIFTLGIGNIVNLIVINTTSDNASSWQYNQLNVTVETVANASDVAGPGLGVESGLLFPQNEVQDLDLTGTTSISPYVIATMMPNTTFVIRPGGGYILLPDATTTDVGSQMTIKNSSNGSVIILTDTINAYFIDLNTTISGVGAPYGNSQIVLAPNEAVVIEYTGVVSFPITSQNYYMYYTLAKVNQISSLLAQTTIDLPSIPPLSPTVIGATIILTDIFNFFDSTGTATGTYTYEVPFPVSKFYFVTLTSSQSEADFPTVILNFAEGGPGFQVILNFDIQFVLIFVQYNGQVIIFGAQGGGGIGSEIPPLTIVGNNTTSTAPAEPYTTSEYQGSPTDPLMLFPCLSCSDLQNAVYTLTNYPNSASSTSIYGQQTGYTDTNGNPVQTMGVTNGTINSFLTTYFDSTGSYPNNILRSSLNPNNFSGVISGYDTNNNPISTMQSTNAVGNGVLSSLLYLAAADSVFKPSLNISGAYGSDYSFLISGAPNTLSPYYGYVTSIQNVVTSGTYSNFLQYVDANNNPLNLWFIEAASSLQTGIQLYNNGTNWMMPELLGNYSTLGTTSNSFVVQGQLSAIFGGSLTSSGYYTFWGGLIIQWGFFNVLDSSTDITVTFPITFPNAGFFAMVGAQSLSSAPVPMYWGVLLVLQRQHF